MTALSTTAIREAVGRRPDVYVTAAVLAAVLALTWPVPFGIQVLGLAAGGVIVLHALGIALVYRASRVINFAQLSLGVLAALMFAEIVQRRSFITALRKVCSSCVPARDFPKALSPEELDRLADQARITEAIDPADSFAAQVSAVRDAWAVADPPGWMIHANYWVAAAVSIVFSVALVWLFYTAVMKRFTGSPRLVLTVITIGAAYSVRVAAGWVLGRFFSGAHVVYTTSLAPPTNRHVKVDRVVLGAEYTVTVAVVAAVVALLILFFRRSTLGLALRGSAENAERARTLGIDVEVVTGRAWLIAGLLASVATVLSAMLTDSVGGDASPTMLVTILVAAAVGGLLRMPAVVFGGVAVGLIGEAIRWETDDGTITTAVLLVLVIGVLLAQHRRASRAQADADATWEASREVRPTPPELRSLPTFRRWRGAGIVLLAIWILGFPWVMSPSQLSLGTATMLHAIVGLSILVLTGWAGQLSLGQMAFAGVGAWTALVVGLPFALSILAGAVVGALFAVIVGLPALRLRGLHLAVSTLVFALFTSALLFDEKYLGDMLPRTVTRPVFLGLDLADGRIYYYATLVILAGAVAAVLGMRRSRIGRALIAAKDNEQAAQSFAISIVHARLAAFAISGFMAAFAGALLAYAQFGAQPISFGVDRSLEVLLTSIVGGLGSVAGPLLGFAFFGLLDLLAGSALGPYLVLFLNRGVLLVVVFLTMPGGLAQMTAALRDAWLRRLAARHGIVVPSLLADRHLAPGERTPIAPKVWPSGATVFVPPRYRLDDEWTRTLRRKEVTGA